jgi:hypothetical protein
MSPYALSVAHGTKLLSRGIISAHVEAFRLPIRIWFSLSVWSEKLAWESLRSHVIRSTKVNVDNIS